MKITVVFDSLDEFERHFNYSPSTTDAKIDIVNKGIDEIKEAVRGHCESGSDD